MMRNGRAGFTLIELLVAIAISVILLSILAFVFRISTGATRSANSRVSLTERLRSLNIRMRQEIGGMLPVRRTSGPGFNTGTPETSQNFVVSADGRTLVFTAATVEEGRPVTVDIKYKLIDDPRTPGRGQLRRYRDKTGPYKYNDRALPNPPDQYKLGDTADDGFVDSADPARDLEDIMLSNVRIKDFRFEAVDPPADAATNTTTLNPRELPAAVRLTMTFGPEVGDPDMLQTEIFTFPVYRGL